MMRRHASLKRWAEARFALPYRALRAAWNSNANKMLHSMPAYPLDRLRQARNDGRFAFDIFSPMGMGAMLTHTVRLLKYADDHQLSPVVAFTNPLYADAPGCDWFDDYFEMNEPHQIDPESRRAASFLRVAHEYSYGAFAVAQQMNLAEARRIFLKYVTIRSVAQDAAAALTRDLPGGTFDLSIHYRATDKISEATSVGHDDVVSRLHAVMGQWPVREVFLATDDPTFAVHLTEQFPTQRFTSFFTDDVARPFWQPRHFSSMSGHDKAIEALVNILVIARSPLCIRTCSHLSAWSAILNPEMRTISLNRLHAGIPSFPEREIAQKEASQRD